MEKKVNGKKPCPNCGKVHGAKDGFHRWAGGTCYWHRTEEGARKKVHFSDCQPQIIRLADDELVYGQPY